MEKPYKIFLRYIILLSIGIADLLLIYTIFKPLTIYLVYSILNIFYDVKLLGIELLIEGKIIRLVPACIAPAAYYLLLILNLSTPMKLKKRVYILISSLLALLLINIVRILILSIMFVNDSILFDTTHKFLWYGLSTIFVVAIWFLTVYVYKIREIPLYTDYLYFRKIIGKK